MAGLGVVCPGLAGQIAFGQDMVRSGEARQGRQGEVLAEYGTIRRGEVGAV